MSVLMNDASLTSMIDFIIMVYHGPLRQNIPHIEYETIQLVREYSEKFPELKDIGRLLTEFKTEVLTHINREEHDFFPILKHIEKAALGQAQYTDCDLKRFDEVIHQIEEEHVHFDGLVIELVRIFRASNLRFENLFIYDHFQNYFSLLENETIRHTELENTKVHPLAKQLFKQVCHID